MPRDEIGCRASKAMRLWGEKEADNRGAEMEMLMRMKGLFRIRFPIVFTYSHL